MHFNKYTRSNGDVEFSASGLVANKDATSNAIEIRSHYFLNGSGKEHFGGAEKWPAITMSVAFQEGEESKRAAFVEALKVFLDKYL